jgi:hypothetical protein
MLGTAAVISLAGSSSALASTGGNGINGGTVFLSEVYTHGAGSDNHDNVVTHGDWIELYNSDTVSQDVSGAVISDDDPGHELVIPNGTSIAAGGYLAIRTDADSLGTGKFSLGDADEARLFQDDSDFDNDVVGDEFDFGHSPVHSWARDFASSPGDPVDAAWSASGVETASASNDFTSHHTNALSGVVINEVNPNGGTNGDWIELYNTNASGSVDVTGAVLSDSDNTHAYVIGTNAGDTLTLNHGAWAAYQVDRGTDNGNFGLGGSDAARLYSGSVKDLGASPAPSTVDKVSWSSAPLTTLGRIPDGSGTKGAGTDNSAGFVTTGAATFGTANTASGSFTHHDLSGVVINEIKTTGDANHGDWIELYNSGGVTRDLSNAIISDNNDTHIARIDNGTTLAAGAMLTIRTDTDGGTKDASGTTLASQPVTFSGTGTFGLGDADSARLYNADANAANLSGDTTNKVDSYTWTQHAPTSYGRKAGQTTTNTQSSTVWGTTNNPTFNATNDFTNSTDYNVVATNGGSDNSGLNFIQLNESTSREMSGDPISNDFIEIINTAPVSIDVANMILSDDGGGNTPANHIVLSTSTLFGGVTTTIPAGGVRYVKVDDTGITGNFGLGSDDDARLFAPSADPNTSIPIDHNEWSAHPTAHHSLQRQNGGLGGWSDCGPMTPGSTNTSC